MNKIQTLTLVVVTAMGLFVASSTISPTSVSAVCTNTPTAEVDCDPGDNPSPAQGTKTGKASSLSDGDVECKGKYKDLDESNCGILRVVTLFTRVLSGIAGLVIVIMIIVGGIQYSMSGADPSKVQAAKQKIINALVALLLFVFGFALLQYLVPGGIL